MKRTITILNVCVFFTQVMFGQLKVANSGNVGIQLGTSTPLSALSIGSVGTVTDKVTIYGLNTALNVYRTGASATSWSYGVNSTSDVAGDKSVGARGQVQAASLLGYGRSWGLLGLAGNATSGYNYGVMGLIGGTGYGAGILGVGSGNEDVSVPGIYAGYFVGDVYVTGTLTGNPVVNSDRRYKRNIADLSPKTALSNILLMNPVEYNLKQMYVKSKGDSAVVERPLYDEKSQLFQKKHYGLVAQDLQKLYPDLVYEDNNGYLSVNYIGLIPLLIESIKELNGEVEALKKSINSGSSIASKVKTTGLVSAIDNLTAASLNQNNPNPFSQSTQIKYYLPNTVSSASLCIYDLQGRQLKQLSISERGNGSKTISASEFSPGIYLYALIADGVEIDVKRMILTE